MLLKSYYILVPNLQFNRRSELKIINSYLFILYWLLYFKLKRLLDGDIYVF